MNNGLYVCLSAFCKFVIICNTIRFVVGVRSSILHFNGTLVTMLECLSHNNDNGEMNKIHHV